MVIFHTNHELQKQKLQHKHVYYAVLQSFATINSSYNVNGLLNELNL